MPCSPILFPAVVHAIGLVLRPGRSEWRRHGKNQSKLVLSENDPILFGVQDHMSLARFAAVLDRFDTAHIPHTVRIEPFWFQKEVKRVHMSKKP